ncbi:MAG: LPXTG cell wall anchor domain-containing protein [Candidatus Fimenecus sp.]
MKKIEKLKGKLSIFLSIMLVFTVFMIPSLSIADDEAGAGETLIKQGEDVSDKANLTLNSFILKGNDKIIEDSIIRKNNVNLSVGDTLKIVYTWKIDDMDVLGKNNYFQVKLPSSEYFKNSVSNDKFEIEIEDRESNKTKKYDFGELSIVDGYLRVTMNLSDEHYNTIKSEIISDISGNLKFNAKAIKTNSSITIGEVSVKINTVTNHIDTGGSNSNSGAGDQLTPQNHVRNETQDKPLHKKGTLKGNNIEWVINVNTDAVKGIYANGFNVSSITKAKAVLIDKLPEGLEIDENSIQITGNVYAPALNDDKTVSEDTGKWIYSPKLYSKDITPNKNELNIEIIHSNADESWEDFSSRIENLENATVGFYKKEGIILNFGNTPSDKTYVDVEGYYKEKSILLDAIDAQKNSNKITDDQYEKIKNLYIENKLPIMDYNVSFNSAVVSPVESTIVNHAVLKREGKEEKAESNEITLDIDAYATARAKGMKKLPKINDPGKKEEGKQEKPTTPSTPTPPTQPNSSVVTPPAQPTSPTSPTTPTPETPSTPITPPTPSNPTIAVATPNNPNSPTPSSEYPRFSKSSIPDANDPESPKEITVIDENGVPLGNYVKQEKPDGTMEYVLMDEEVPLGAMLPKTGENGAYLYYLVGLFLVLAGAGLAISDMRRKRLQK